MNRTSSILNKPVSSNCNTNCVMDLLYRDTGFMFDEIVHITGVTGSQNLNVFKVTGTVRILNQIAVITEVTTLTNCTNVYADLWDGSNSVLLTADGVDLSGVSVGGTFTKDKLAANTYTLVDADQCNIIETIDAKKIGRPFTVVQKNGADTYIRFNFTTTDDPIDFKIRVLFEWKPINGGNLELA